MATNDRFNGILASKAIKVPCVVASDVDLTLSGNQLVNGVNVVTDDRVLVMAQTNAVENGIYDVKDSDWQRAADWDGNRDITQGTLIGAYDSLGALTIYVVSTTDPIFINTTAITIELYIAAGGGGLADGTITDAMLRWDGVDTWRETDRIRSTANGAEFRVYETTLTDYIELTYVGTSAIFSLSNAGHTIEFQDDILVSGIGTQLILPAELSFTAPTLAFGDGTAGFIKTGAGAAERIGVILNGTAVGEFLELGFSQGLGTGAGLRWAGPTSFIPSVNPNIGVTSTGLGVSAASDPDYLQIGSGGVVLISRGQPLVTAVTAFAGAPVSAVFLHKQTRLLADLATATPPTTETPTINYEIWDDDSTDKLASFGFNTLSELHAVNHMEGGQFQIHTTAPGGAQVRGFRCRPSGSTDLYEGASGVSERRFRTTGAGVQVVGLETASIPSLATDAVSCSIAFTDGPAASSLGQVGFLSTELGQMYVENLMRGSDVVVKARNDAGTQVDLATFDPDTASVYVPGMRLLGDVTTATPPSGEEVTRGYEIWDSDNTDKLGSVGFVGGDTLFIDNFFHGGSVVIRGEGSDGATEELIRGNPDGSVSLYHDGQSVAVAQTAAEAAGGFQVRNSLTGGGLERVLTESDAGGGGGSAGSIIWAYNAPPAGGDPGAGNFTPNNANPASWVWIEVDNLDSGGTDIQNILDTIPDQSTLVVRHPDGSQYRVYAINSIDNNAGYDRINVNYLAGTGDAAVVDTEELIFEFNYSAIIKGGTNTLDSARDFPVWDAGDDVYEPSGTNLRVNKDAPPVGGRLQSGTTSGFSTANPHHRMLNSNAKTCHWFIENSAAAGFYGKCYLDQGPGLPEFYAIGSRLASTNVDLFVITDDDEVRITTDAGFFIADRAAARTPIAGFGELWVRTSDDGLMYTREDGSSFLLNTTGASTATWSSGGGSAYESGATSGFQSGAVQTFESGSILEIEEASSMADPAAGHARIWIRDDTPNRPMVTDDAGDDQVIQIGVRESEVVTATNVITAAESGKTFYLDAAGGFTSTLPVPALGLHYKFIVSTAPTTAYIITTNAGANILEGTFLDIVGELQAISAQDTLNFVASTALVGDSLEVESDGTNWYCTAFSKADGGITVSVT